MKYFRHFTQIAKTAFPQKRNRSVTKKHPGCFLRLSALALAIVLVLSLFPQAVPQKVQAAGSTQEIANLVIFVKSSNDSADVFNAGSNWSEMKKMYNTGSYPGRYNNSFSNYISVITEGKVHVTNYFPQESADGTRVQTLALSGIDLSDTIQYGDTLVEAVLDALGGIIPFNTSAVKYDNLTRGVLDNLTIIIQSTSSGVDTVDGQASSYKNNYGGQKTVGGLHIGTYNVLYSNYLVANDGGFKVGAQQGVIAHEFLHTLGLPDLYRLNSPAEPVGYWDIMAKATCFPQYPLSYLRAKQGWVTMGTITQSGTYTLTAVSESGGNKVFALKTPLSDTELICIEYRMKNNDYACFEHKIPSSGLLMYRVNNNVQHHFNSNGENYIYVYRPGVTDPEAATDMSDGLNLSWKAALSPSTLNPSVGEGSYGSTDLSADFTQDTLYYSDGRNSGIRISDVRFSGNTATFTVTFADYSNLALWEKVGESVGTNVSADPVLYSDPASGALYLAYEENNALFVKKWDGSSWQQLGSPLSQASNPALSVCDGVLYLSVASFGNRAVYYQLNGNSWAQIASFDTGFLQVMQFIPDGSELYGAYIANSRLTIRNIKTGALVTDSLSGPDFANPALIKLGNCFYMACSEFYGFGSENKGGHIKMYDMSTNRWSTVCTLSSSLTNEHYILKQGQKIYVYAGLQEVAGSSGTAVFAEFDGNSWSKTSIPSMTLAYSTSMSVLDGEVYLSYYDNADHKAKVLKRTGSSFSLYSDTLGTGLKSLRTCSDGATLYAVTQNTNSAYLNIWKKAVSSWRPSEPITPDSPTESTPRKIVLTPPSGYQDNHIYIDGIEYTAQKTGSSYSLELPDTTGKTAVMYCYNEKNVPVGMYVWKLSWQGQFCQATPLPGLQDLLSYHGFSIRIKAPAGIRFTSGIDVSLKQQLLSTGVDGYKLSEYGTLVIPNEARKEYPLIKGGEMVRGGRAYWVENGKTYDNVFSTVAGRNYFTSVLINLSSKMYATDLCFRSYAVLTYDGQEIIIYGPPVSRSIYMIARQLQARNEFAVGSSGYNYIQGIIDSVEKK